MSHHIETSIKKWGNGLGLRISGLMRKIPDLTLDTPVVVEVFEDGFTVRKAPVKTGRLPFTEKELLQSMTPDKAHAELLATPHAYELGGA